MNDANNQSRQYDTREWTVMAKPDVVNYHIYLIPPLGFGQSAFQGWLTHFPNDAEVIYLGYAFDGSWDSMIAKLAKKIKSHTENPFIIIGHALGGTIAYEVCSHLEQQLDRQPLGVFVSSAAPPAQLSRLKNIFPFNQLDLEDVASVIHQLEKAHFLPNENMGIKMVFSKMIVADANAIIQYSNKNPQKINAPIFAVHANNDVLMRDKNVMGEWDKLTRHQFNYLEVEGGHLFFLKPPMSLFEQINRALKASDEPFKPGVYQITSMTSGSGHNVTYPFGENAEGFILYHSSSQAMAVFVWQPKVNTQGCLDEECIIKYMNSSFSYSGNYSLGPGVVYHQVKLGSLPRWAGNTLSRHFRLVDDTLILTTRPPKAYQCFTWKFIKTSETFLKVCGCWDVISYTEKRVAVLGENPTGLLIISNFGYLSLQVANKTRDIYSSRNPLLIENSKLLSAYHSFRSFFARFESNKQTNILSCHILSKPRVDDEIRIAYELSDDELKISWKANEAVLRRQLC